MVDEDLLLLHLLLVDPLLIILILVNLLFIILKVNTSGSIVNNNLIWLWIHC